MKCFRCGAVLPDEQRFCGHCGIRLSDPLIETMVVPEQDGDSLLRTVQRVFSGEYEVEEELGRGGMAVVYKATETALRRTVALKVLPPDTGLTPKAMERFKREAQLVAGLDHPNITPVYRAEQVGGIPYIAMKYVEGRTLDRIIQDQGALPVPVVLSVLRAAGRALTYAHEQHIVHRDVKSGNILVDRDGRVLVSDFGVALRASDVTLTAAGTVIGTPAYMSPEQCAGRRATPKSDQYSLGIVAFQMLTGALPFHAENLAGLMQHHFFTPVPDLAKVRDDLPPSLIELVGRLLAKDGGQRFATTREMLTALGAVPFTETERQVSEGMLRELSRGIVIDRVLTAEMPALPDMPTLLVEPARRRRRPWLPATVGAAVALALLGGVGLWVLADGNAEVARVAADSAAADSAAAESRRVAALVPAPASSATVERRAPQPPPRPPGLLRIITSPPDAEILVDGRREAVGSLFNEEVRAGERRIQVRAPGYASFDTTVVIQSGALTNLGTVRLQPPEDLE